VLVRGEVVFRLNRNKEWFDTTELKEKILDAAKQSPLKRKEGGDICKRGETKKKNSGKITGPGRP